jgi:hypothetical protein
MVPIIGVDSAVATRVFVLCVATPEFVLHFVTPLCQQCSTVLLSLFIRPHYALPSDMPELH